MITESGQRDIGLINKEYIKNLEEEVRVLKSQVTDLTSKIDYYKNILQANNINEHSNDVPEFIRDENFHWSGFPKTIQETPELVKASMHMQLWESSGTRSPSRLKFINDAFSSIINHIAPTGVKLPLIIYRNIDETTLDLIKEYRSLKYK